MKKIILLMLLSISPIIFCSQEFDVVGELATVNHLDTSNQFIRFKYDEQDLTLLVNEESAHLHQDCPNGIYRVIASDLFFRTQDYIILSYTCFSSEEDESHYFSRNKDEYFSVMP